MKAVLVDILTATLWETQSQNHLTKPLPDFQKLWEITSVFYCKLLSVNIICYAVMDN